MPQSRVTAVQPFRAIEGGRITISGTDLLTSDGQAPDVSVGGRIFHLEAIDERSKLLARDCLASLAEWLEG